jgi:hypothetical protein
VFTARYGLSPYLKQTHSLSKGLKYCMRDTVYSENLLKLENRFIRVKDSFSLHRNNAKLCYEDSSLKIRKMIAVYFDNLMKHMNTICEKTWRLVMSVTLVECTSHFI